MAVAVLPQRDERAALPLLQRHRRAARERRGCRAAAEGATGASARRGVGGVGRRAHGGVWRNMRSDARFHTATARHPPAAAAGCSTYPCLETYIRRRRGWAYTHQEFASGSRPNGPFIVAAAATTVTTRPARARAQVLVNVSGTQWAPVTNVSIDGVTFRAAAYTYMEPHGVPSAGDWALERMGAVFLEGTEFVELSNCVFERLDGHGVMISGCDDDASSVGAQGHSAVALWHGPRICGAASRSGSRCLLRAERDTAPGPTHSITSRTHGSCRARAGTTATRRCATRTSASSAARPSRRGAARTRRTAPARPPRASTARTATTRRATRCCATSCARSGGRCEKRHVSRDSYFSSWSRGEILTRHVIPTGRALREAELVLRAGQDGALDDRGQRCAFPPLPSRRLADQMLPPPFRLSSSLSRARFTCLRPPAPIAIARSRVWTTLPFPLLSRLIALERSHQSRFSHFLQFRRPPRLSLTSASHVRNARLLSFCVLAAQSSSTGRARASTTTTASAAAT